MQHFVLIVAGGTGQRFGSAVPKQFLLLRGLPVIMHSFRAFYKFNPGTNFVLMLPESYFDYWHELCATYHFTIKHTLVAGGQTRFHSVKNGLEAINSEGLVAVHDAVRPLVSQATLERCFALAAEKQSAIPVTEMIDSVRKVGNAGSFPVNRNEYVLVQTPQVFETKLLKKAYAQEYSPEFTDDASVVEKMGRRVSLCEGNRENIKITNPADLLVAEALFDHLLY